MVVAAARRRGLPPMLARAARRSPPPTVVFALDSIPAVFGITQHAYIVFAANAFALLGLRPLYFLVSGLLDRLVYLSSGLAVILGFIGAKLVLHFLEPARSRRARDLDRPLAGRDRGGTRDHGGRQPGRGPA